MQRAIGEEGISGRSGGGDNEKKAKGLSAAAAAASKPVSLSQLSNSRVTPIVIVIAIIGLYGQCIEKKQINREKISCFLNPSLAIHVSQLLPNLDFLPRPHRKLEIIRRLKHEDDRASELEASHLLRGHKRLAIQQRRGRRVHSLVVRPRGWFSPTHVRPQVLHFMPSAISTTNSTRPH